MKDKNSSKNTFNQSTVIGFLSVIAFSVIIGGLFFSSQPEGANNRFVQTSTGSQEVYFTAAQLPEKLDFAGEAVPL